MTSMTRMACIGSVVYQELPGVESTIYAVCLRPSVCPSLTGTSKMAKRRIAQTTLAPGLF